MMKSSIILPLVLLDRATKRTTAFTIISSSSSIRTNIATLPVSTRTAPLSLLEVENSVSDTRYPLSLTIPMPIVVDDNDVEDNNNDEDEDIIHCIHYPTVDGTLPASTNIDTPSLSSSAPVPPMPIADNNVKKEEDKEEEVVDNSVCETRYPLSLSVPLPIVEEGKEDAIHYPTVNSWTADPSKFCAGLPGAVAPLGNFDPLHLTSKLPVQEIKRYREAETTHGRVAMLAVVGFLVAERYHPFFNGQIQGPASTHLTQVREMFPSFFAGIVVSIATIEIVRANIGWEGPIKAIEKNYALERSDRRKFGFDYVGERLWLSKLNDSYYPGDIGFDPFQLKPKDPTEFATMQTKELQHGRLAMIASLGMIVQEQITHATLF